MCFNVVLFHLWSGQHLQPASPRLRDLISSGYTGVSFFFILSGFILAYAYGPDRIGKLDRKAFWWARFARIYPVYALSLLLSAYAFFTSAPLSKLALPTVTVLTSTQSWMPSTAMAWNYPAWTMSSEVLFYILFPFLAPPIARLSRRGLLLLAGSMAVLLLLIPMSYLLIAPDGLHHVISSSGAFWLNFMKWNPLPHVPEFVLGLALGYHFGSGSLNPRIGDLMAAAGLLLTIGLLSFSSHLPYVMLHSGGMAVPFALMMYGLGTGGLLAKIFGLHPLFVAGEGSYALYILQAPVFVWLMYGHVIGKPHYVTYYLLTCVAFSIVVLKLVEVPARDLIRGWVSGPQRRPAAGSAARA